MPKVINKTEQSIYECLLGFPVLTFPVPQIWLNRQFLLPNSRNEEMMGDGFLWCYCCRFALTVNVC